MSQQPMEDPKTLGEALDVYKKFGFKDSEIVLNAIILVRMHNKHLDELTKEREASSPAIQSVIQERQRQDSKWGQQNHEPMFWMGILGEEFGELCQAVNETTFNNGPESKKKGGFDNMRDEAIQVAAVAIAFVEMLDRSVLEGNEPNG